MIFLQNISKGHHSVKSVGGVTALVLCTSPDGALHLYPVSRKIS